jgi:two-component system, sensor histidine kinase
MLKRFRNLSIRHKLISIILITSGIVLSMVSLAFFANDVVSFRREVKANLEILANIVGRNTAAAIAFSDPKAAKDTLNDLVSNGHIMAAYIIADNGRVFASYFREGEPDDLLRLGTAGDPAGGQLHPGALKALAAQSGTLRSAFRLQQTIIVPFSRHGRVISTVVIHSDSGGLEARLGKFLLLLVVVLALAILIAYRISEKLQGLISGPIIYLLETMNQVTNHRSYQVRAVCEHNDELGDLFAGFNVMLEQIEARDEQLRLQQNELEEKVAERTCELEETVVALREAQEASDLASRAKSQFLANMSHEIRTPMNAILGYAQLIQRNPAMPPELKGYSDVICRSGDHLLTLINDVLEMSKIEAGRVTCHEVDLDFHALLRDVMSIFLLRTGEKGVGLELFIDPAVPSFLRSDNQKLRQILINVVGNAVKFTERGSIAIRALLGRPGGAEGENILVEVEDTGCGIAGDELPKVFDAFEQTAGARDKGGTGLGMSISRQYALLLDGDLAIRSEPGRGTVVSFTFRLHATKSPPTATRYASDRRYLGMVRGTRALKVLVVDDLKVNRDILRIMLTAVGFAVEEAADGSEAVALAQKCLPDIVLIDRRMPVMDGLDATLQIKAIPNGKAVPVIVVSASALDENRQEALTTCADGFVGKPFREAEIMEEIRRLIPEIVYLYEDAPLGGQETRPETDFRTAVACLPYSLLVELRGCIEKGDISRFEEILDQHLKGDDQEFAGHLAQLAALYDYDGILRLLPGSDDNK